MSAACSWGCGCKPKSVAPEKPQEYEINGNWDQKSFCRRESQIEGAQIVHSISKLGTDSPRVLGRRKPV